MMFQLTLFLFAGVGVDFFLHTGNIWLQVTSGKFSGKAANGVIIDRRKAWSVIRCSEQK